MNKLNSISRLFILFNITFLVNLWYLLPLFKGNIFGDPFDARLQIVLHEHWWRWVNGLVKFRDTEFFYPFQLGLGLSDNFLIQGLIHSFFRNLNFSIVNSWIITNSVLLIFGNIGWIFLANKIFKNFINSIFFVGIMNLNIQFISYFVFQVNTVSYVFLSWVLYLCTLRFQNQSRKFFVILSLLILYALISWYAFFFLVIFLIILFFVLLANFEYRNKFKNYFLSIKNSFNILESSIFIAFSSLLISIFIYIYFPVRNVPSRSLEELRNGSLKLINLIYQPNNFISNFSTTFSNNSENFTQIGINISLILVLVAVIILNLKSAKVIIFELSIFLSTIIVLLNFINFGSDFIPFKFLYLYVPGFDSIRYTHRFVIFLTQILIIIIFLILDKNYLKFNNIKNFFIYFLLLPFLTISQIHPYWSGWNRDLLINENLQSQSKEIKSKCDYFYFDTPGGWWFDQIEAMYFAYEIGVPTVNGYSGGFPIGYPQLNFNEMNESQEIFTWISRIDKNKSGCYLTGKSPIYELNSKYSRVDKVGFDKISDKSYTAVSPYPYLFIFTELNKNYILKFTVQNNSCSSINILSYKLGENNSYKKIELKEKQQEINININSKFNRVHRLIFSAKTSKCEINNYENYFYLKDIKLIST